MKRHIQFTGIRNWYGGDLIDLQAEPLKILDGFFSEFGSFILSGCRITQSGAVYNVSPGIVALQGKGPQGEDVRVVAPFEGADGVALPLYLTLKCETLKATYVDGNLQPVAYVYKAIGSGIKPGVSHMELSATSSVRFNDVLQDTLHRFITDAERVLWNSKETTVGAQAKANKALSDAQAYADTKASTAVATQSASGLMAAADKRKLDSTLGYDYVVDSDAKLAALHNNSAVTSVLIAPGTWTFRSTNNLGIILRSTIKKIVGAPGSELVFYNINNDYCLSGSFEETNDFRMEGVKVRLASGSMSSCFSNMWNMYNCIGMQNANAGAKNSMFSSCANLYSCEAQPSFKDTNTIGFDNCKRLFNCIVKTTTTHGYSLCTHLNYCQDASTSQNSYYTCSYMLGCRGVSIRECNSIMYCNASTYTSSYSSTTANSQYVCADTLAGGWNR